MEQDKQQRVETAISDLFFNMEHAEYSKLMKKKQHVEVSDIQQAIENDAVQMVGWLEALGHQVTPESLVIDFFDRV